MQVHRRKSSKDEDENVLLLPNGTIQPPTSPPSPPTVPRVRVNSTPTSPPDNIPISQSYPPSAGPFRTSFSAPRPPNINGVNGHSPSPFRTSFSIPSQSSSHAHSRTRSVSGPFAPPLSSPLSMSFPSQPSHPHPHSPVAFPSGPNGAADPESDAPPSPKHSRRHSRMHSRNLSVFFPRPGSLPQTAIAEDGGQEVEVAQDAPVTLMPSANGSGRAPERKQLEGFTFGGRPPGSATSHGQAPTPTTATRRGHHHKHSMSHQFFSFLEPGSAAEELHTQPTPTPQSPWNPISPFPASAGPGKTDFAQNGSATEHVHKLNSGGAPVASVSVPPVSAGSAASAAAQFVLGAWIWVTGQQIGSLSCTGLGYWVVFDAFGVALSSVLPGYLAGRNMQSKIRRPYGNGRIETVAMFAQSVYLMFASVYVCKETVEHFLLSAGEGHHHHPGDEDPNMSGIVFPTLLILTTLVSLLGTAAFFNNNTKLVNITDNRIPLPAALLRSFRSRYPSALSYTDATPTSPLALLLTNPFTASPVLFCVAILFIATFIDPSNYRVLDLLLASVEAAITFNIAYRACVVLGTVLLQTSPERGLTGGRMEAFLRAMREIERHPKVLHLPAPHIWQLTPTLVESPSTDSTPGPAQSLIVTLELHVREDMGDDDVLELTRWAWERCVSGLHFGSGRSGGAEGGAAEAEVTVGVVRG
ncbi:hypothetical protein PLICRDRAFT_173673 [Plicaturopsis crispa FD-325 SS-3]|nr:hypothetical protein PLICRDRAFT_173673 [Plicaturopsis crispa FD-325 SS-3]